MLIYIYPLLMVLAVNLQGPFTFSILVINIVLFSGIDHLLKNYLDRRNISVARFTHGITKYLYPDTISVLYVFVQAAVTLYTLVMVSLNEYRWWELYGLATSLGLMNGTVGISLAHEYIHRLDRFHRFLGNVLLGCANYMHFSVEHIHGHHINVGTEADPASAHFGDNFYSYFAKTCVGQFKSALTIEHRRTSGNGLASYLINNRMIHYIAVQTAIMAAIYIFLGLYAFLLFLFQSFIAIHVLECVNFMQHYGLRRKIVNGKYEKVSDHSSWECDFPLSSLLLHNLNRHALHHQKPKLSWKELTCCAASPQLPSSYFIMAVIPLIPPIWRHVMDKRTTEYLKTINS